MLLTNFLHHFDHPTNVALLKKVHAALQPGGRAVTLEFVPNEDRVSPPMPAGFSMIMLTTTPAGDAYTFNNSPPCTPRQASPTSPKPPFPGVPKPQSSDAPDRNTHTLRFTLCQSDLRLADFFSLSIERKV